MFKKIDFFSFCNFHFSNRRENRRVLREKAEFLRAEKRRILEEQILEEQRKKEEAKKRAIRKAIETVTENAIAFVAEKAMIKQRKEARASAKIELEARLKAYREAQKEEAAIEEVTRWYAHVLFLFSEN